MWLRTSFLIFISFFLFIKNSNAKIIETTDASVIRREVLKLTKDDLVIFDVKGVIFSPKDQILAHQFKRQYKHFIEQIKLEKGEEEAKRLESIILLNYEPVLVDQTIPGIIKTIQSNGTRAIALTSGYTGGTALIESREDLRLKTLKNFGIDFSSSFQERLIRLDSMVKKDSNRPKPLYKNGVIFTAKYPKQDMLESFLRQVDFKPKRLVHIDNNIEPLQAVEKFAKKVGIDYLGIYYTKIHENSAQKLDMALATKKFEILVTKDLWVSDEAAKAQLRHSERK